MEYWAELGILASYLIPSLALGVVFRRPVIKPTTGSSKAGVN